MSHRSCAGVRAPGTRLRRGAALRAAASGGSICAQEEGGRGPSAAVGREMPRWLRRGFRRAASSPSSAAGSRRATSRSSPSCTASPAAASSCSRPPPASPRPSARRARSCSAPTASRPRSRGLTAANAATMAHDPGLIARVGAFGSVYFTGGDQSKIVAALAPGGVETPLLARDPRRAGGGRARRRLERRGGDDEPADDRRRHLDRVGAARADRRPRGAGADDGGGPRLLPVRDGRPALHQARPARAPRRRHGRGRGAPRLRHRREHRAARRGRRRPRLRRVRGDGRRPRPGDPSTARRAASATSVSATSTTATASSSPAASGRAPARPSGGCASARWPTAPRPARGATPSAPTRSTT